MSQVNNLLYLMRQFTPKGQEMVINILKENKTILNKDYGFADLPRIISDNCLTDKFEKELVDKKTTLREIIQNFLKDSSSVIATRKIYEGKSFQKVMSEIMQLAKQTDNNIKSNPRGKKAYASIKHFDKKKLQLLEYIENQFGKRTKLIFTTLNPENVDAMLDGPEFLSGFYYLTHPIRALKIKLSGKPDSNLTQKFSDYALEMQKIMLSPSKDKRVRRIEHILREKYGLKYVYLDNFEEAQNALKSVKFATEHNIPIGENLIVTPFIKAKFGGENYSLTNTVMINVLHGKKQAIGAIERLDTDNKNKEYLKVLNLLADTCQLSTPNSMHPFLHEFLHYENPVHIIDVVIPEKYKDTVERLSKYAAESFNTANEEIRVELRAKQLLEHLNKEEEELLTILQSAIK